MSKGVVWYDNVALNFKAWLGGVITTVPITTIATPVPTTQGGTGTSTTFPSGRVVVTTTGGVYTSNANFLWSTTLEAVGIGGAPSAGDRLAVSGNIRLLGAADQIGFASSNGTKIDLTNGGASIIVQESGWGIQIGAGVGQGAGQGFLRIVTGDGELMRIGGGANVLIGVTAQPGAGSKGLVFGRGTALGTMSTTTAAIYSTTLAGVTRMHAISGDNVTGPIALYSEFTTTSTGTVSNLDFSGASIIRMNNATDATITGLVAGVPGQIVVVVSVGAGNVLLKNEATSTAANQLKLYVTSADIPLVAGKGTAVFQYDGTTQRWRLIHHKQGAPITAGFSAGDFSSDAGSWTVGSGDIVAMQYELENDFLTVQWAINTTSVAGGPIHLDILNGQWGGFTAFSAQVLQTALTFSQGGVFGVGFAQIGTGAGLNSSKIFMYQVPIAAWANATDTTAVYGGLRFQVA